MLLGVPMRVSRPIVLMLLMVASVLAEDKYPLSMTAVFTPGKIATLHKADEMYHSGDYDCARGDEHNAPECHTVGEWACKVRT
jgi:hypothetical protein